MRAEGCFGGGANGLALDHRQRETTVGLHRIGAVVEADGVDARADGTTIARWWTKTRTLTGEPGLSKPVPGAFEGGESFTTW
jgi:hypothetical protein